LTHAGKPAHVAGAVVHAFGWLLFLLGLGFSLVMGLLVAIFSGTAGLVTGGVFAALSLAVFLLARYGKRRLDTEGDEAIARRREQALFALAANRGGRLQAFEAASALDMTVDDADKVLTQMAKQRPDDVDVEIGDQGEVFYEFARSIGGGRGFVYAASWSSGAGFRVGSQGVAPGAQRVRVADPAPPAPASFDEKQILDAEFEAIDEPSAPQKARR
jgi:membrane protein implicated in regulation of membrane protease activity